MKLIARTLALTMLMVVLAASALSAQAPNRGVTPNINPADVATNPDTAVARVDGQPIRAGDVQRVMMAALAGTQVSPDARAFFQAQALEQLVGQRLVSSYLLKNNVQATPEEFRAGMTAIESQALARSMKLDDFLAERGLTADSLRDQITWDIAWNKYARSHVTDDELQTYFKAHQREYDGTEVRASHVLLRPVGITSAAAVDALVKRAQGLREEILSGKLTFEDAAKRYSSGPSRNHGGDVGFFPRHDRMVEAFSAAAFALEPGSISQPVVTYFGVHLIKCTEIKPGVKTWQDAKNDLLVPAAKDLFARLAAELRTQAKVEYTGAMPFIDPTTKKLVVPVGATGGAGQRP